MKKFKELYEGLLSEITCGKNKSVTIVTNEGDAIQQLYNKGFAGKDLWYEENVDGSIYVQGPPELVDAFMNTVVGLGIQFDAKVDGEEEVV